MRPTPFAAASAAALLLALTSCATDERSAPASAEATVASVSAPPASLSAAADASSPSSSSGLASSSASASPVEVIALFRWVPDNGTTARSIEGRYSLWVDGALVGTSDQGEDAQFPSRAAGPGQWLLADVPGAMPGSRVQVIANPKEPLHDGHLECSLTVMNASEPLDRAAAEKDVSGSVTCDAVVPQG